MDIRKAKYVADCPECEAEISFERMPQLGHMFNCPHCDTRIEVIETKPLELDWALDYGDEYDDDFDDDFEYDDA